MDYSTMKEKNIRESILVVKIILRDGAREKVEHFFETEEYSVISVEGMIKNPFKPWKIIDIGKNHQ